MGCSQVFWEEAKLKLPEVKPPEPETPPPAPSSPKALAPPEVQAPRGGWAAAQQRAEELTKKDKVPEFQPPERVSSSPVSAESDKDVLIETLRREADQLQKQLLEAQQKAAQAEAAEATARAECIANKVQLNQATEKLERALMEVKENAKQRHTSEKTGVTNGSSIADEDLRIEIRTLQEQLEASQRKEATDVTIARANKAENELKQLKKSLGSGNQKILQPEGKSGGRFAARSAQLAMAKLQAAERRAKLAAAPSDDDRSKQLRLCGQIAVWKYDQLIVELAALRQRALQTEKKIDRGAAAALADRAGNAERARAALEQEINRCRGVLEHLQEKALKESRLQKLCEAGGGQLSSAS